MQVSSQGGFKVNRGYCGAPSTTSHHKKWSEQKTRSRIIRCLILSENLDVIFVIGVASCHYNYVEM